MSAQRFIDLLALTRAHDPQLYAWVAAGWSAAVDGDDIRVALELSGSRGTRHRNRLLIAVADDIAPGQSPFKQGEALALAVDRALGGHDDGPCRRIRSARAYGKLPRTARQLYNIIRNEKQSAEFHNDLWI